MIKAGIFDVDGTILDSMGIWEEAGRRYLKQEGIPASADLDIILKEMTLEEAAEYLRENYLPAKEEKIIIQEILGLIRNFYYYEAELKPGVRKLMEELSRKRIPLAIATSSERDCIERAFGRLKITSYFEKIFTCSEVGAGKHTPKIFQEAADYLGAAPEEIVVFEDALYAAQTAKNAGFFVAAIRDFSEKEQERLKETVDIYVNSWEKLELEQII